MWIVGLLCLGVGIGGFFPTYGAWQMPLWLAVTLTVIGALVVIISPSSGTQEEEPAQRPPPPHQDEHPYKGS